MANANLPRGLTPVGNMIASDFNEQGNLYCIPTDASNTYAIGDVVMAAAGVDSNGVKNVQKWGGNTTTSAMPVGIIVGIRVADPGVSLVGTSLSLEKSYIGLSAGTRYVYVIDDPSVLFVIQCDSTALTTTTAGYNFAVTVTANQTTLSTTAPFSSIVATGPATTATLPICSLGLYQTSDNAVGAYARILGRWNYHAYAPIACASGTVSNFTAV